MHRSIDEVFYMCEFEDSIKQSEEAIDLLQVAQTDFKMVTALFLAFFFDAL